MSVPQAIGSTVAQKAQEKSIGQCLKYVRQGIQRSLGEKDQASNIGSAKDAEPRLLKRQFKTVTINQGQYQNGDVVIIDEEQGHPHGHIQVYHDGRWYSDFKQKTPNPWLTVRLNAFKDIRPLKAQYRRQETQITHVSNHKDHPKQYM